MTAVANPVVSTALPHAIDPLALSLNENPFPPLPMVRSALIRSIDAANRYPEFLPERLRCFIAHHIGVYGEQVALGAGATGVVMQVLRAMTNPGDTIVMATPTFDGYPICAQIAGLRSVAIPLDEHGHHNLDAFAEAAAHARVVVLCRPHNPTGTLESAAEVMRLLRRIPSDTIVLLDEAYIEFVAAAHRMDTGALIACFGNVVVIRTFSKAYGLAGLRIGYGVGAEEVIGRLWTNQLPFGVAITGLVAVAASYAAEDQLRQRVRLITGERRHLRTQLAALGVFTTDSHANFVYLPPGGASWREVFADTGVQVRCYADGGARITVGGRASTQAVLAAVGKSAR
jgi:histidinol-phosphate aminotransferase